MISADRPEHSRVILGVLLLSSALCGCATAPDSQRQVVAVKADTVSRDYSSINARVLSESAEVDHRFVTSLDGNFETLKRLESAYTQHIGDESMRVGDSISSAGMWGSSVRYGGMQFGTRLAPREDVIASTQLATTGLAVLPTVADALFASAGGPDASLAQQQLSVGRSIRPEGSQLWDLSAADAAGRSESISAPMIADTRLVERGCSDFSVGMGKVRRDYAIMSNEYGPLFANTTVACAAPLGFTVEGHGEYLADQVAALGFGLARRLGALGTASAAFASSRTEVGEGWLARVGFDHQSSLFNVMLRSRMQSREFREIATAALADPIMQRDLASVGVNVSDGANLSLAYATQVTWGRERTNLIALKQSLSVGRGSLSMSAGHSLEDNFGSSLFISYKRPLGGPRVTRSIIEEFDLDALSSSFASP
jgi:outer membrane usher protein